MGAVTTLCNFDIMNGSKFSASAHIAGLQQMVKLLGGLETIGYEQRLLLRIISWCDMSFAASWGGSPRFPELDSLSRPPLQSSTGRLHFPDINALPKSAPLDSYQKVLRSPLPNIRQLRLCPIGHRLYMLSTMLDSGLTTADDREFFACTMYSTQHHLLHVLARLQDSAESGNIESFIKRSNYIDNCLYLDLALRDLVPQAEMHYILVRNLKFVLGEAIQPFSNVEDGEAAGRLLIETWDDLPEQLLWGLFVGAVAAAGRAERVWFVGALSEVSKELGINDLDEFRTVIKLFRWLRKWASSHSERVWKEVELIRRNESDVNTNFDLEDELLRG